MDKPRLALAALALIGLLAALLMPVPEARATGSLSTSIEIDDGGYQSTIKRPGYRLDLELKGEATFTDDESDLATLSAGGVFELREKKSGVTQKYLVKVDGESDSKGALIRSYERDGDVLPLDAAGRAWVKAALLTAFRTTGLDAEARAARLLARGPDALLTEIVLIESDFVRATYLGIAFADPTLATSDAVRAYALAQGIGSDYELRRALAASLKSTHFDAARADALLEAARQIGSDYELAELLVELAPRLPTDASTLAAWRATANHVDSDFELRRAIVAVLESGPAAYRPTALEAAGDIGSDFEMRSTLTTAAPRLAEDPALLGSYLDCVEQMGSDFEQREALTAIAQQLTAGSPNGKRYLEIARDLGDFERGEALAALLEVGAL